MKHTINILDILTFLQKFPGSKSGVIAEKLGVNRVIIHNSLKKLLEGGYIQKTGKTPHTFYSVTEKALEKGLIQDINTNVTDIQEDSFVFIPYKDQHFLGDFYKFLPDGNILSGKSGLESWAKERKLDPKETLERFIQISKHIDSMRDDMGCLDATSKFDKESMEKVYFMDQYIYGEFGRGPLAELAFYAKLSQHQGLMKALFEKIIEKIITVVHTHNIDAIAIVPPSIDRKYQLLSLLQKKLSPIGLPFIDVYKHFPNRIPVAQKTLKSSAQRIQNAQSTIHIRIDEKSYNRVLLIDDFVGSGATLNITAKKLKSMGIANTIIGLAIVGNLDMDYEVINEI